MLITGKTIPKNVYDIILKNVPIVCVDVVISIGDNVLLVKRNDPPAAGHYWFPGGRIYKGEHLKDAAKRKAKEEVGLDCEVIEMIYTNETMFPDGPNDIPIHSVNTCWHLIPHGDFQQVTLDEHHTGFKWVREIDDSMPKYIRECLLNLWKGYKY